jgi:hypothetical protein
MSSLIRLLPTLIKVLAGVGAGQLLNKVAADANVRRATDSVSPSITANLPIIAAVVAMVGVFYLSKKAKI